MTSDHTVGLPEACALVGVSERAAYERARAGRPLIEASGDTPEVPILRVCGTWKVPRHLLLTALRLSAAGDLGTDVPTPPGVPGLGSSAAVSRRAS